MDASQRGKKGKRPENSNTVTMTSIYKAVRNLSSEHQEVILTDYKFAELYFLFKDKEKYREYIDGLVCDAVNCLKHANALTNLYDESLRQIKDPPESRIVEAMQEVYGNLSEDSKKEFFRKMTDNGGFFQNAYKSVMDVLAKGRKEYKSEPAER